jgi:hypothetical protein
VPESIRMAAMCDAYEVNVASHYFSGPLSAIICAHFAAVIPNLRISEYDVDEVPWKPKLLTHPPVIENGEFVLPTGPGWGTDVNEDELARARRYCVKPMIIDWHTHVHSPREQAAPFWRGNARRRSTMSCGCTDEVGPRHQRDLELRSLSEGIQPRRGAAGDREANDYLALLETSTKTASSRLRSRSRAAATTISRSSTRGEAGRPARRHHHSSHRRAYPDDDEAKPFFGLCCDLDIPVFMHPPSVGFGEERMKEFRLGVERRASRSTPASRSRG